MRIIKELMEIWLNEVCDKNDTSVSEVITSLTRTLQNRKPSRTVSLLSQVTSWNEAIAPVFNIVKLSATLEDPILGRKPQALLPPIIIDGEEEWEVEEILNSRWH